MNVAVECETLESPSEILAVAQATEDSNAASALHAGKGLVADTIASSIVLMLVMAVVQRGVGFVRGLLVCRWLEPSELGQWDMALAFLVMAAPLAVLGLPGSFGRYLEHYRQRGHLRTILARTTWTCSALTLVAVAAIVVFRANVSQLLFGTRTETTMVCWLAASLVVVVAYNFFSEALVALRLFRFVSLVQFINSLVFAALSIVLVIAWQPSGMAIVVAYGGSCLAVVVVAAFWVRRAWRNTPPPTEDLSHNELWRKLMPFAAWVWVANLLFNMFDVADRYLIVHFSNVPDPLELVGQYHSSRVVPLLMVSVAVLLGGMILPHMSHDWEAGRRSAVSLTVNLTLKLLTLALVLGGAIIALTAPWLFEVAFHGKYSSGLHVLPGTLTYCIWLALASVAQTYLWCAERARAGSLALAIGLAINVVFNLFALPRWGLPGAVMATTAANGLTLLFFLWMNRRMGMRLDLSTVLVALLPVVILAGPIATLIAWSIACLLAWRTRWILSSEEKQNIAAVLHQYVKRVRMFRSRPSSVVRGPL